MKGKQLETWEQLKGFILTGAHNGRTKAELGKMVGRSAEAIKKAVAAARRDGERICAGYNGYYYAESHSEWEAYLKEQERQAFTRLKNRRNWKAAEQIEGQMEIDA